jgi:hypothetical protein
VPLPRLRQLVLAAPAAAPVSAELARLLGSAPYVDPGVGGFGLENAVHSTGDAFVEVVAPLREDTAVGRWLARTGGPGGYMLMLEVDDAGRARQRLDGLGVRVVWEMALPGVVDLHLHPKDTGGALLALDAVDPPGSWPWGGAGWTRGHDGGLVGVTVAVEDPAQVCRRWAAVLAVESDGDRIVLADQQIRFVADGRSGIVEATLRLPAPPAATAVVGGVTLHLEELT